MKYGISLMSKIGDKPNNEDYCNAIEGDGIYCCILADGLGGFEAGEVASKYVVDFIENKIKEKYEFSESYIENLITLAHKGLLEEQKSHPNKSKMRSTAVVMIIDKDKAIYGYTGDSRLYMLENGKIALRTKDHSVCQSLVNVGELKEEEIRFHEDKNKILKVLGQEEGFGVTSGQIELAGKNDVAFLLCSDGVWENLDTLQIELELCKSENVSDWIKNIERLILLNGKKGMDNYSMIGAISKK